MRQGRGCRMEVHVRRRSQEKLRGARWSLSRDLWAVAWSASDYYWPTAEFQGRKQTSIEGKSTCRPRPGYSWFGATCVYTRTRVCAFFAVFFRAASASLYCMSLLICHVIQFACLLSFSSMKAGGFFSSFTTTEGNVAPRTSPKSTVGRESIEAFSLKKEKQDRRPYRKLALTSLLLLVLWPGELQIMKMHVPAVLFSAPQEYKSKYSFSSKVSCHVAPTTCEPWEERWQCWDRIGITFGASGNTLTSVLSCRGSWHPVWKLPCRKPSPSQVLFLCK